ncbi:YjbF family lipoprotein [Litorisediminicola beolgyonensis]|uniref:YjbF family lipoprotein n=1 Tax=Litorisediminicola beolgyonensis TaxID=1173614 RepID=A0ABW3ZGT4_9RHOB
MNSRFFRRSAALALTCLLAACGPAREDEIGPVKIIDQTIRGVFGIEPEFTPFTPKQLGDAVRGTQGPLILIEPETRDAQALMIQIERNGSYATFATPELQTVTLRRGLVVATRGLGGDLMSSEEDALLALIARRSTGQARYTMRFLDGADQTREVRFTCTSSPRRILNYQNGVIPPTLVVWLDVTCTAPEGVVEHIFLVDGQGEILRASQWVGDLTGHLKVSKLRR